MVSQKALLIRDDKCLIIECADKPNVWEFPGGRVDKFENGPEAFKREIKEELGFNNFENLGSFDYEIWYTKKSKKPVCLIAILIKNQKDNIKLSKEHTSLKWITKEEANKYEFASPGIVRIIKNGFKYKKLLEK